MKGLIFSIKKYSVHDGPGIRMTFFMKGCPLSCPWCHNPEGISPFPEEIELERKVGGRKFIRREAAGIYYSAEEITTLLEREKVFFEHSKGGVTFSGGEPMLQHEFLIDVLRACRSQGYHTAVDTAGYSSREKFRSVLPFADLFLFDIKHLDDERHIELTGVSNRDILSNYMLLLDSGNEVMLRFPVIPGMNDSPEHLEKLRNFISSTKTGSLKKICLLPFHRTGLSKYRRLNMHYRMEGVVQPSAARMIEIKNFFMKTGIKVKIGG